MPKQTDDTRLVTILLIIIGAFVIFPMFFMGFGMMGYGSMMGGMWGGGMWGDGTMSGWMFIVGIVMQLLFLAAIVGGGYLIYRAVASSESDSDQALEELRLAYARGELTDEEYEQRREALERDTESRQD
ncbi:SHOCT domain-containing protein [Natrinema amylolyticum]|uniref:SHOCT domain-containing protein n=1 Tax=Natrinema amylolyticum TaxID=2878679 RepID=UPI001CF95869|nr:SHOCT domain-containing protein [Natrinema amylolyticum]